jgi:hypothetical protein
LYFLLSKSDLERESLRRERALRVERKKSLGALKFSSAHGALAVQYKPLASTQILVGCLLYNCNGL